MKLITLLKVYISRILLLFFILSIIISPHLDNIYCGIIVLIGWKLIEKIVISKENFLNFPLMTISLVAFGLFYFCFNLIVTVYELKPLTFNLISPIKTFTYNFLYLCCLCIAFSLAKKRMQKRRTLKLQIFLQKINFYKPLSNRQVWIIGLIGMLGTFMYAIASGLGQSDRSTFTQIMINFMSLAPFPLLFLIPYYANQMGNGKKYKLYAWIYLFFILLIGTLSNRRILIVTPLIGLFLMWFLSALSDNTKKIKIKHLVLVVCFIPFFGVASRFMLALSSVRADLGELSSIEVLDKAINNYGDTQILEERWAVFGKESVKNYASYWNEYYVDNIILDRFCNMKPIDSSVSLLEIGNINEFTGSSYLRERFGFLFTSLLPLPLIKLFDSEFDKYSDRTGFYDYYLSMVTNSRIRGHYKIGGDVGIGVATFGYLFFIFSIVFYYVYFLFLNCFGNLTNKGSYFYILMLASAFLIFQTNQGFMDHVEQMFRTWPVLIFSYLILIRIIK